MSQSDLARTAHPSRSWLQRITDPAVLALLLGLLGTLPLVLLTPPFQVPDEPAHFFRAYQLSELGLLGVVHDGDSGAVLPSSLPELEEHFLGTRELHTRRFIMAYPLVETLSALRQPLDPGRREFVNFTNTAPYSPLGYLPQATAIAIGRAAGLGPLALLYLARLANAVTAVLVIAGAVRLLPFGREAVLLCALLPMELYEYASASQDAAVIASATLFTAISLRCQQRGRWRRSEVLLATAAATVFCGGKLVYAPLLAIGLPSALRRGQTRHVLAVHAGIAVVALGFTVAWFSQASALIIAQERGADIAAQTAFIIGHPLRFISVILLTLAMGYRFYYQSAVGVLGWLNLPFPSVFYVLPPLGLLCCLLMPGPNAPSIGPLQVAWNVFLITASTILLVIAQSLYDDTPGAPFLVSIQGRYLLPLSALAAATVGGAVALRRPWRLPSARFMLPAIIAIELVATAELVAFGYQVF